MSDHDESTVKGQFPQLLRFYEDRFKDVSALRPAPGMCDRKVPRRVLIQMTQDGVVMGFEPPVELAADKRNVSKLHVGVQLNQDEPG